MHDAACPFYKGENGHRLSTNNSNDLWHCSTEKSDGLAGHADDVPSTKPVLSTLPQHCASLAARQRVHQLSGDKPEAISRPPRGFRDFPPESYGSHRFIFNLWRSTAETFGFREYKAPAVEHARLFVVPGRPSLEISNSVETSSRGVQGPNAPPHIYFIQNKGTDELCLRPEITPSFVRMILREHRYNPTRFPRRWYCIERVWRHERPCRGRRREHFQWNLDIAIPIFKGPSIRNQRDVHCPADFEISACAELIAVSIALFQKLGLTSKDVQLRIGSRQVVSDIVDAYLAEKACSSSTGVVRSSAETQIIDTGISFKRKAFDESSVQEGKLQTILQALDRADRREETETQNVVGSALGISAAEAGSLLQRLKEFDVFDSASMSWLLKVTQNCEASTSSENATFAEKVQLASSVVTTKDNKLPASVRELCYLMEILHNSYGYRDWVKTDLSIVRGLNYYTGLVFEAFDTQKRFRALLGGGVYFYASGNSDVKENKLNHPVVDPMSECASVIWDREIAGHEAHLPFSVNETSGVVGVGLGMGDCVLLELLHEKNLLPVSEPEVDVIVLQKRFREEESVSDVDYLQERSSVPFTFMVHRLCHTLRSAGLRTEFLGDDQRNPKAVLKYAGARGAQAVLYVERPISAMPVSEESMTAQTPQNIRLRYRLVFLKHVNLPEKFQDPPVVNETHCNNHQPDASNAATGQIKTQHDIIQLCNFMCKCVCTSNAKVWSA